MRLTVALLIGKTDVQQDERDVGEIQRRGRTVRGREAGRLGVWLKHAELSLALCLIPSVCSLS